MRRKYITITIIIIIFSSIFFAINFVNKKYGAIIFYNQSPSMPKGIYLKNFNISKLNKNDIIIYDLPKNIKDITIKRKYINPKHPLLKYIGAIEGDFVCIKNNQLFINDKNYPIAKFDSKNKKLPQAKICRKLKNNEIFTLGQNIKSLDSRHHGLIYKKDILSKVNLILSW